MTKAEFKELLQDYTSSTRMQADEMLLLTKQYPYSQVLHSLSARLSKDHSLAIHEQALQQAAVYAADRSVLKAIMTASPKEAPTPTSEIVVETVILPSIPIDYADEVIHDLEILHELKHNFELLVESTNRKNTSVSTKSSKTSNKKSKVIQQKTSTTKSVNKKSQTKDKKSKLKAKNTLRANTKASLKNPKNSKPAKKPLKKIKANTKVLAKSKKLESQKKKLKNGDELLTEIEATKRKLAVENQKQLEQIKLIDKFIHTQPRISNTIDKNRVDTPGIDLVNTKQGEFGEQVITETLASILISQGKKEKAIEVLKKLIWKFPQKKAYFATKIEELKG